MTMIRHKLIQDSIGHWVCDCGYDPFFLLDAVPLTAAEQTREVLAHIKQSRRWRYIGLEFHYGFGYYIWENDLGGKGKRFAIPEERYLEMTGVSRNPRLEIRWTA